MKSIERAIKSITLCSVLCISLTVPTFAATTTNQNALIEIERYKEPSGGWQPGDSREIKFAIKNNTNKKMAVKKIYMIEKSRNGINLGDAFEEMAKHTWITIKDGDKTIKEDIKLIDFFNKEDISKIPALENYVNISPGQIKELSMLIDMKEEMGNPAQSLSKVFKLGTIYTLTSIDEGGSGGGGTIDPPIDPEKPIPPTPEEPTDPSDPDGGETTEPEKPGTDDGTDKPGTGDDSSNNGSDVGGSGDKLPQTGGIINGFTLTALGIGVAGLGIVLDRKSSDKGGKSDE